MHTFIPLFLYNLFAEGGKGKSRQLEMLSAERDSDNGNAKDNAEHQMWKTDPNASQTNPKNVHDDAEASSGLWSCADFFTKRA